MGQGTGGEGRGTGDGGREARDETYREINLFHITCKYNSLNKPRHISKVHFSDTKCFWSTLVMPADTINFITSAGLALSGVIFSTGTINRLPEKL